ncbi:MAG: RNB domain-containing ribonuclease [Planctomycetota bacterium]|nr:RNB domain-containing ribonuclease [Planctomycetota bacterium]
MNTEQKPLQQRILDAMSRDSYRPLKRRKLATLLGMIADQRDYAQFKLTLGQLVSQGLVVKKRGNKYELAERANTLVGLLTVRGTNYGFVNPQGRSGIVEIRRGDFGTAMHGDIVEVEITQVAGPETAAQGKVVNITRAGKRRTVGTAVKTRFGMFFIPIRGGVFPEVPIDAVKGKKLKHGELVTVEFIRERYDTYRASVVERLGHASEYSSTIEAILRAFEIPGAFPSEVSREAKNAAQKPVDEKGRKDYRELVTVTIDPDDAKDFDDAISIEQLKNGGTRLYVHIADVADVVPRGSVLDEESRRRATSVYLPGFVVPMLPHHISNERCCLRPQEDRPAKTVVLDYDASGNRTNYSVHRSMIRWTNASTINRHCRRWREARQRYIPRTDRHVSMLLRAAWSLAGKAARQEDGQGFAHARHARYKGSP